jgi:hypothetical protein
MLRAKKYLRFKTVMTSSLFGCFLLVSGFLIPLPTNAFSIKGTTVTLFRGYQDLEEEDRYSLAQGLKIRAYEVGLNELSFHGYFQYYGDSGDDFSESGMMRLYHGYLKYQKAGFPFTARAGRFFLYRGVAIGVLDGGEVTYKINPQWSVTAFGGQQGPLSREWEVDRQGDSPWFGGEVRWRAGQILGTRPTLALSYTRQERDEDLLRHLAGLSIGIKLDRRWTTLNVIQANLDGSSALRKALTRWRYSSRKFQCTLEAAAINYYVAPYSYFSDFDSEGLIKRVRNTLEYHYIPRTWGVGLSSMYFGTSENGFRTGPYVIFPFGRIGYHYASGDQPTNNGLWGYFNVSPVGYLDLFAYAATMEYEWEAMDLGTHETTTLNGGFKFRPPFLKRTQLNLEWQNYSTPELESYRRIIASLRWNFDYQGTP